MKSRKKVQKTKREIGCEYLERYLLQLAPRKNLGYSVGIVPFNVNVSRFLGETNPNRLIH